MSARARLRLRRQREKQREKLMINNIKTIQEQLPVGFELTDETVREILETVEYTELDEVVQMIKNTFSNEEPVVEEPVVDEPVVDEPVVDEPVVDEPVVEEPVVDEPVVEAEDDDDNLNIVLSSSEEVMDSSEEGNLLNDINKVLEEDLDPENLEEDIIKRLLDNEIKK